MFIIHNPIFIIPRLLPPVTTVFRKTVKDDILGGYPVPAGTPVGISVGALHRSVYCMGDEPDSYY